MPILGAHMSIAGGFHKAVERAKASGCDCVQIFTASPSQWSVKRANPSAQTSIHSGGLLTENDNQWRAKPLSADDATRFQDALRRSGVTHPIAHDSYLINLASPDDALRKKSIAAYVEELRRAEHLGLACVVTHPGAHTTSSEEEGIERVAAALDEVDRATQGLRVITLLELTAGQGSCLGWKFEHLADILNKVRSPDRLGVCFDTCHAFAAGYPLSPKADFLATMRSLDKLVGLQRVRAFHLNDSKGALGCRVDRHDHIGRGKIGLEAFSLLLNDRRFRHTPMYLETRKELENGVEMDVVNLAALRGLVKGKK
jgi:deoxyribonuclease IV